MNHEDCLDEQRIVRARLAAAAAAQSHTPEIAARLYRFLMLFREVPLTEAEKRPDPDYGL